MIRDFTLTQYAILLKSILEISSVITLEDYFSNKEIYHKFVILRHDVDKKLQNAVLMADIEKQLRVRASYYFRIRNMKFGQEYVKKIANMKHEIGYHYEDLSSTKGDHHKAIQTFRTNLGKLRAFYPVKTICMHGSPLSRYDNRKLWNSFRYRDYGIIGEPYFDINFNEVLYLTDTGRTWNTFGGNIRDKVQSKYKYHFKSTSDIIQALKTNKLPDKIMLNVHPQRWNDKFFPWAKELVWQKMKNVVKNVISK